MTPAVSASRSPGSKQYDPANATLLTGTVCSRKECVMQQEHWIADRAMLQRLLHLHPEWTQQELANWIGRSKGWVKKWVKRLREAPPGDSRVLLGKPLGRKTPYPQTDPQVEERTLAIRDAPPENLQRTPGPRAILYYLPRDPELQQRDQALSRSTRTIWKILRRNDRISQKKQRKHQPLQRPLPLEEVQRDFKDMASVPRQLRRQAAACRRSLQLCGRGNLDLAGCPGSGGFSRPDHIGGGHPFPALLWPASQDDL